MLGFYYKGKYLKFCCFFPSSFILPFIFSFWLEMQFLYYLGSLINEVGSGKFAVFQWGKPRLFYFIFSQGNFNIGKSKQHPEVPLWPLSRALDWKSEILFLYLAWLLPRHSAPYIWNPWLFSHWKNENNSCHVDQKTT